MKRQQNGLLGQSFNDLKKLVQDAIYILGSKKASAVPPADIKSNAMDVRMEQSSQSQTQPQGQQQQQLSRRQLMGHDCPEPASCSICLHPGHHGMFHGHPFKKLNQQSISMSINSMSFVPALLQPPVNPSQPAACSLHRQPGHKGKDGHLRSTQYWLG